VHFVGLCCLITLHCTAQETHIQCSGERHSQRCVRQSVNVLPENFLKYISNSKYKWNYFNVRIN